jgi:viologen exporter family transport system permease protein
VRVLWAAFASGVRRTINQPGELAVRILFYVFILVVFAALWDAAVDANNGPIGEYGYTALLWYVTGAEATVIATKPRLIEEIGYDIADGSVAVDLLRPMSVVWFRMAVEIGEAVVRLIFASAVGALVTYLYVGRPPSFAAALLSIPAAVLGASCIVAAQFLFGAAAFWLEDAKSTWILFQKLIFLLGGMLIPLELLPGWFESVARFTPFVAMAYVPARLLSGTFDPVLLLLQVGWFAALVGAATSAFAVGERRLQGAGG